MPHVYQTSIGPITSQIQLDAHTSTHTCLAMLVGIPADTLINQFDTNMVVGEIDSITILAENGLHLMPIHLNSASPRELSDGVYLLSLPSLNYIGEMHTVIASVDVSDRHEPIQVIDPNINSVGSDIYTSDIINEQHFKLSSVVHRVVDLPNHCERNIRRARLMELNPYNCNRSDITSR